MTICLDFHDRRASIHLVGSHIWEQSNQEHPWMRASPCKDRMEQVGHELVRHLRCIIRRQANMFCSPRFQNQAYLL